MTEPRIIPPAPPSHAASLPKGSGEADFWAGLFLDLTVRVEWLEQALDAVPSSDTSALALVRLRSYAQALDELHKALQRVQAHRADPRHKPLFSLDGPLAGYLSRLYAWCEEIGEDFERMAVALRRHEPTTMVFSHRAVNSSYAHFEELVAAIRRVNDGSRGASPAEHKDLDEHLEELIWATEWVHMTLARRPGE